MKRLVIALCLILVLFASCNTKNVKTGISLNRDSLNTGFSLKLKDTVYSGVMYYSEKNEYVFEFNEPEYIKGIIFSASDNKVSVTVDGVTSVCENPAVKPVICELTDSLEKITTKTEFAVKGELFEYSDGEILITLDKNCNLVKIKNNIFCLTTIKSPNKI